MELGVTLFNPRRRQVVLGQDIVDYEASFGMLVALDAGGEVVQYHRT